MKIIFLAFTPYHIKVCNYLANKENFKNRKKIILSSFSSVDYDVLRSKLDNKAFDEIEYYNLNYNIKDIIKNISLIKKMKIELEQFVDSVEYFNPDKIYYFSAQPIPYQYLFNKLKEKNTKLTLVEEGLGLYNKDSNFKTKQKIQFIIRKLIYGKKNINIHPIFGGNYESEIIALEPKLVNAHKKNIHRIKLSREEYKSIIYNNPKLNKILDLVNYNNSTLMAPVCTNESYPKGAIEYIFNTIFYTYTIKKKHIYLKLHPADKNKEIIRNIVNKYNKYVHMIEDKSITSEELLMSDQIDEVISDFSSTLINAHYSDRNVKLITYYNLIEESYGVKIIKNNLFEYMVEYGIIEKFKS